MIKINEQFISITSDKAKKSPRKRKNYNFHKKPEDTLQRMLNAIEPDTYIQPHKHENPDKREVFFVLRGKILVVEFDDEGNITDHIILDPSKGNYGAEIPSRTWHVIISLEKDSVAYEVKDGPYNPEDDKHFAPWSPKEGDDNALDFNKKILRELKII
ncbi:MAG: WbuC family cupin fold metalloprotein [Bacteroidales bacterium]|nr:WbuC family cupin fold metalloprotein [Bacteroidales bacterium]